MDNNVVLYKCIREKDTVIVSIIYDKYFNKYRFVNLNKNHICKCRFDTIEDAVADMERLKQEGKLIEYKLI